MKHRASSGTFNPNGKLSCGCILSPGQVEWCSMHEAAPALLAALKRMFAILDNYDMTPEGDRTSNDPEGLVKDDWDTRCDAARAAIRAAEGQP